MKHNYSGVCTILDSLSQRMKSQQPDTNQPKQRRKRNRAAPAASIHEHKEADLHLEGSEQRLHLQSVAASWTENCLETNANPADPNIPAYQETETNAIPADPGICLEATCSGLSQARNKERKRKVNTVDVQHRRTQLLDHLLDMAANGLPLSVRDLYDSFRRSRGATADEMTASKIKLVLNLICSNHNGIIEYIVLKREGEEAEKEFIPCKKRSGQPPQVLAGMVPVGGRILYYYKNSTYGWHGSCWRQDHVLLQELDSTKLCWLKDQA
eukprot:CAMPEP_0172186358 /NCGR_PEP_ID=MMETSP1050-20130122/20711_1 /TAXON_ID=233186 /ORGANISM="Cryptomonas curvata, Strain CCAP979/52" /LENGTH=268 /DNA_ID=CAMNT_0012860507 /DNA_START=337 /DNA_END=1143 /DNA_ORIENTATION=-